MTHDDFADKGYSCQSLDILDSEDWKYKPKNLWSEEDWDAYHYQEGLRIRQEMIDIRFDID